MLSASLPGDGTLTLRDGRSLAWHEWGTPDGTPCLWLQGTPGSRLDRTPDLQRWQQQRLRVLIADRPGFGRSTRAPGALLATIADDLVELLDHLQLDKISVIGASGGGPHALAICAAHPDRVRAATVVSGVVPLTDEDLGEMLPLNAEGTRRARKSWESVYELVAPEREAFLADPLAAFQALMATSPASDRELMGDPAWQEVFVAGMTEALRQGAEGWADESMRLFAEQWDLRPEDVSTHVVWWHGRSDGNVPVGAVERFTARMPSVDFRLWDGGHLAGYRHEDEIFADLLAR